MIAPPASLCRATLRSPRPRHCDAVARRRYSPRRRVRGRGRARDRAATRGANGAKSGAAMGGRWQGESEPRPRPGLARRTVHVAGQGSERTLAATAHAAIGFGLVGIGFLVSL